MIVRCCCGEKLLFAVVLVVFACPAAAQQQRAKQEARFVGSVGCSSSSCHGGAGDSGQYLTWVKQDFHARAFAVLTNARSARIAETLGIPEAHSSTRCTTCHSPFHAAPPHRLTSGADPREGVSCESCHGAAEGWLRGHTRKDWTYATRVGAGMRDLKSTYVRANTCVACHQNIDSDIAAAGHPELVFALSRQLAAQPPHWRDHGGNEVREWIAGQAAALRELSWKLSLGHGDARTLAQWNALAWLLSEIEKIDPPEDSPTAETFPRIQQQADALARRAAQQNFTRDAAERLLRQLLDLGEQFPRTANVPPEIAYRRAERLTLGIDATSAGARLQLKGPAPARSDFGGSGKFDAEQFAAWIAALRDHLLPKSQ
jgi:hypothetical protein